MKCPKEKQSCHPTGWPAGRPMKVKDAKKITESLTRTSKMPGLSYSLPAWACQTGSKLRLVPTSPCFGCYALKGNYITLPSNQGGPVQKRLDAIKNPLWVEAMAVLLLNVKSGSGGTMPETCRSLEHMYKIIEVCKLTPDTQHWLPTQERQYLPKPEDVPANLIIRLSAAKVDGTAGNAWTHSSTVVTDGAPSCSGT